MCQVNAYYTELAATYPCMALIEIHDSETHWTSTVDIANEIHDPIMLFMIYPTRVPTHNGLDKIDMFAAGFNFNLRATSELLASYPAPLPTSSIGMVL